jgi:parvulin-like peptidyl-prolyl isomerase
VKDLRKVAVFFIFAVFASLAIFAAGATPTILSTATILGTPSTTTVVALVNGQPIYSNILDMAANVSPTLSQLKNINPQMYNYMTTTKDGFDFLSAYDKSVLSNLVDSVLMEQIAQKNYNIVVTDAQAMAQVKAQVAQMLSSYGLTEDQFSQYLQSQGYGDINQFEQNSLFTMKFSMTLDQLKKVVTSSATVTTAEAQQYYNANIANFQNPPEIDVEHISLSSQSTAASVLALIKSGKITFESAASRYSLDTNTKNNNGDLGWIPQSANMPDFETQLFAANIGDIIGPVQVQSSWELFKVVGKKGPSVQSFADAQSNIIQQLLTQKQSQIWSNWLKNVFQPFKNSSTIKIML